MVIKALCPGKKIIIIIIKKKTKRRKAALIIASLLFFLFYFFFGHTSQTLYLIRSINRSISLNVRSSLSGQSTSLDDIRTWRLRRNHTVNRRQYYRQARDHRARLSECKTEVARIRHRPILLNADSMRRTPCTLTHTHTHTLSCSTVLTPGLSGVVDSVIDTLRPPERVRVVKFE